MRTASVHDPSIVGALLTLFAAATLLPEGRAQCQFGNDQVVQSSIGSFDNRFGSRMEVCGDLAVISAALEIGNVHRAGALHVYRNHGGSWQLEQILEDSQARAWDELGYSVDTDGDVVIGGAPGDDTVFGEDGGSATVFRRVSGAWVEEQKLIPSTGGYHEQFGVSAAVEGEFIAVGVPFADPGGLSAGGTVFVFQHIGGVWVEVQQLVPSDQAAGDEFGTCVDIDGDTMVVGSYYKTAAVLQGGQAYVFRYNGSSWVETDRLVPADLSAKHHFGWSCDLEGDAVVIGARGDAYAGPDTGSAYVFRHDGSAWQEEQKLVASDGGVNDLFGLDVAISAGRVAVGAIAEDALGADAGSVYLYAFDGGAWNQVQKLSRGQAYDSFGYGVALDGPHLAVGRGRVSSPPTTGRAYFFHTDELDLSVDPTTPAPGASVELLTCGVYPTQPVLLAVVGVSGSPVFLRAAVGSLDPGGRFRVQGTVPAGGLGGVVVDFRSLSLRPAGTLVFSPTRTVAFP